MKDITNLILVIFLAVILFAVLGQLSSGDGTEAGSSIQKGVSGATGGVVGGILDGIGGIEAKIIDGLKGMFGFGGNGQSSWAGNSQPPSAASDLGISPLPYGAPPEGLNAPGGYEIYGDGPPVQGSPA